MSWWYRRLIRPILFSQDAEQIHRCIVGGLAWASRNKLACEVIESFFGSRELPSRVFGLSFRNPIGLAAGMDKDAEAPPAWAALGFGFSELGGVTWHPQTGNPPPRLFRAIADEVIINRMGFNNAGAEAIAERLTAWRALGLWPKHPVGINLGKSKVTPLSDAAEEYARTFRHLRTHADFFVVNVSSPNTPGLRDLQDKAALDDILSAIQEVQREPADSQGLSSSARHPILVKVSPDLNFEALDEILELVERRKIAGIVATNTTLARPSSADSNLRGIYSESGGLSGGPLRERSTQVIRHLYKRTMGKVPIVGVGGVFNATDAWEKMMAGASLVQVYTGLVYEGPGIAGSIVSGLLERMENEGVSGLSEVVGGAHK